MKKILCVFLCAIAVFSWCVTGFSMTENEVIDHFYEVSSKKGTDFADIDGYPWAVTPIKELAKRGIVAGDGNGNFLPANTVSRFEFIKMITGVCGIVNPHAQLPYTDVPTDHWAYMYVASAYEAGLLDIYSDVVLNGAAPITREEIAYISVEAMLTGKSIDNKLESMPEFADSNRISDHAVFHVATLSALKVINGKGDGIFAPKDFATRAESAKIIYNILCITEMSFN